MASSLFDIEDLTGLILFRPSAHLVEKEFNDFASRAGGREPCKRASAPSNQCAVRMSVALCRAMGKDIFRQYPDSDLHSAKCCDGVEKHRHVGSAQGLFEHLSKNLPFHFRKLNKDGAMAEIADLKGILFFDHIKGFIRKGGSNGDHIDYWDGKKYSNSARGARAAGGSLSLFKRARTIWFCQL